MSHDSNTKKQEVNTIDTLVTQLLQAVRNEQSVKIALTLIEDYDFTKTEAYQSRPRGSGK